MTADLLKVEDIDTYYGQSHVLQRVSLAVEHGKIAVLLGRNGAGKSTALKSIMGIKPANQGIIRFRNQEIQKMPTHLIARLGISYVPEEREIFPSLTVEEHLNLRIPRSTNRRNGTLSALYKLFPLLFNRRHNRGNQLSGGEQQLLSIARAIALKPHLLILDEPTEGLAPVVIELITNVLETLRSAGTTILIVEQNYPFALSIASKVYVLGKGRIRWQGTVPQLEEQPEVKSRWLGL